MTERVWVCPMCKLAANIKRDGEGSLYCAKHPGRVPVSYVPEAELERATEELHVATRECGRYMTALRQIAASNLVRHGEVVDIARAALSPVESAEGKKRPGRAMNAPATAQEVRTPMQAQPNAKACTKCGQIKPLTDFNRARKSRDGRNTACRECSRQASREWKQRNPEKFREGKRRSERSREAERQRRDRWKRENPEAVEAHHLVEYELRVGRMVRPETCGRCGRTARVYGHHADYFRPLDVEWLCARCHRQEHHSDEARDG